MSTKEETCKVVEHFQNNSVIHLIEESESKEKESGEVPTESIKGRILEGKYIKIKIKQNNRKKKKILF